MRYFKGYIWNSTQNILPIHWKICFSSATKQLYAWFGLSVFPSVCLSVTPISLRSHHRIIIKFSGVITIDRSDVHVMGQSQRSKVKITEFKTQFNCFRAVAPVWVHIWWRNYAQSLMWHRRYIPLFFKVFRQIWRFRDVSPFWIDRWLWNEAQNLK